MEGMDLRHRALLSGVCLLALLAASPAVAASYGTLNGTNFDFIDINDTTLSAGDPDGLFGAPMLVGGGDQIQFFPTNFEASAAGAGGFDDTRALLNMTIMGVDSNDIIESIMLDEVGDFIFAGVGFTAGTNVAVTMSGVLTVLETSGGPITPVDITFSSTGDFVPVFNPAGGAYTADVYGSGSFSWDGAVEIDVASFVPDATKVELQLNNFLFAFSEAGASATIQKKDAGISVTVIPEPGTALLVGAGLIGLGLRSRCRRA